jgi:uncharacterized protein HemX
MRENNLSLEATVLTSNLELFRIDLENLKSWVSLFDKFNGVLKLIFGRHSS